MLKVFLITLSTTICWTARAWYHSTGRDIFRRIAWRTHHTHDMQWNKVFQAADKHTSRFVGKIKRILSCYRQNMWSVQECIGALIKAISHASGRFRNSITCRGFYALYLTASNCSRLFKQNLTSCLYFFEPSRETTVGLRKLNYWKVWKIVGSRACDSTLGWLNSGLH